MKGVEFQGFGVWLFEFEIWVLHVGFQGPGVACTFMSISSRVYSFQHLLETAVERTWNT